MEELIILVLIGTLMIIAVGIYDIASDNHTIGIFNIVLGAILLTFIIILLYDSVNFSSKIEVFNNMLESWTCIMIQNKDISVTDTLVINVNKIANI